MDERRGLLDLGSLKSKMKIMREELPAFDIEFLRDPKRAKRNSSINESLSDTTVTSLLRDTAPVQEDDPIQRLHALFMNTISKYTTESEVFGAVEELIRICEECLSDLQASIPTNEYDSDLKITKEVSLKNEIRLWKLLHALYRDRLTTQNLEDELIVMSGSEKDIVDTLYAKNATLREYQLIVDWLEDIANQASPNFFRTLADCNRGWENTHLQLTRPEVVAFAGIGNIVSSLDPDAPQRENRPLHPLDKEDNDRLVKAMYYSIRQGRMNEALALAKRCGQTWRAIAIEGWRLHDDPNYEPQANREPTSKLPLEGNPHRSVWKLNAWRLANRINFEEHWRVILAALSGNLGAMKECLRDSWDDLLWAYLKVQIDIRVESELRSSSLKSYVPMPQEYWDSKMSLESIFNELSVHKNSAVREYAKNITAELQQFIILDYVPELIQSMNRVAGKLRDEDHNIRLPQQLLRMFTHIVLFMRQIGRLRGGDAGDQVIAAYIESLIKYVEPDIIAFYAAALSENLQIEVYANYLAKLNSSDDRFRAFQEACTADLKVLEITIHAVSLISSRTPDENNYGTIHAGEISKFDTQKIKGLELLTYLSDQRPDLIWYANALIRYYLAEGKTECVRAVIMMVPVNTVAEITEFYGGSDCAPPPREQCSIKEFICYQVFIVAYDIFNEWSTLMRNKPKRDGLLLSAANKNFTERMICENEEKAFQQEEYRWKEALCKLAEGAKETLLNVLTFPERGWLADPDIEMEHLVVSAVDWENRKVQLEKLRVLWIPQITLMLHEVLHQTGQYKDAIALVEYITDGFNKIHKCYTKARMAELLAKITKSSLEMLNLDYDAFGYIHTQN